MEPIAEINAAVDRERLDELQTRVLALRIPVLLGGFVFLLWAALSALSGLGGFFLFGGMGLGTSLSPSIVASIVTGALTALLDLLLAGVLIGSGAYGFAARSEPRWLVRSARLLLFFWWLLVFRILAAVGSMMVSLAFVWSGLLL